METIYASLGEESLAAMVAAFYRRVRTDDLLGPMYPEQDFAGAEKRLLDFLVFRFGGPQRYIEERGHPRLRMRHIPFSIGMAERDRWLVLMGEAMREAEIPETEALQMAAFFAQVADMMRNRPEQP